MHNLHKTMHKLSEFIFVLYGQLLCAVLSCGLQSPLNAGILLVRLDLIYCARACQFVALPPPLSHGCRSMQDSAAPAAHQTSSTLHDCEGAELQDWKRSWVVLEVS